ncbi:MAG: Nif3-like dinuclear metal center hexameric protein [Ruminococcaceae bacterium]|nr:Nif3-like dinuclear metal center hexameric protein [Oscillospiraceae bacterium]
MAKIKDIISFLENRIPKSLSMPGDNDGFALVPDSEKELDCIALALDVSLDSIEFAKSVGAQLLLTHHPTIFSPLYSLKDSDGVGKRLLKAAQAGIALAGYHTRLDAIDGGVNDTLCALVGIKDVEKFEDGLGRVGYLEKPMSYGEFCAHVGKVLGTEKVTGINTGKTVHRVAVVGGSGKGSFYDAYRTGADTFLTGEVAHNTLLDGRDLGMNLVLATHYRTEVVVLPPLGEMVKEAFPHIKLHFFGDNL